MSSPKRLKTNVPNRIDNFINGKFTPSLSSETLSVLSPITGDVLSKVPLSNKDDLHLAISAAQDAFMKWNSKTIKARAAIMTQVHVLLLSEMDALVDLIVIENGKNRAEAKASVAKGIETLEWAVSLPASVSNKTLTVSRGITCSESRDALGIVASIVPFNFPAMVPMWTVPIALVCGNVMILKPSEKVPLTMNFMMSLFHKAGVPNGVFQIVHGTASIVQDICAHPDIAAVTFVGSSKVAEIVASACHASHKRVLALGGAKNHLVALPDADFEMAASDIVASFAGCAGQRCMAASVLLLVGNEESMGKLVELVVAKAAALTRGTQAGQVGAIIDEASQKRILGIIDVAEIEDGAKVVVDGRSWATEEPKGYWIGPTVLLHSSVNDAAFSTEIFGPVLSVLYVSSFAEALRIENENMYGNAASIYTTVGAHAEYFQTRFRAGMIGVNIGVPVPREPFSFGGLYGTKSKYGDMDITGDGGLEFFTSRRKITSKWGSVCPFPNSTTAVEEPNMDAADFTGHM